MSSPDAATVPSDLRLSDFAARAETDLAMLARLAEVGMMIAEEIGERAVNSPYHPEAKHEPGRAFANVSRAIRLTIVLRRRVDKDLLAIRSGKLPTPGRESVIDPRRDIVQARVNTAINRQITDRDRAIEALDWVHESLIDREDYEDLLDRPLRECVEVICGDLGLEPNWNLWSDETGFPPIRTWPHQDWTRHWSYDPIRAHEARRRRAERPPLVSSA